MTKPMTEWDRSRIWTEADRLNRTPEAFCELPSQAEIDRTAKVEHLLSGIPKKRAPNPRPLALIAAALFWVLMLVWAVFGWVPALVQAIGWSG